MNPGTGVPPFLAAWLQAQQGFAALAGAGFAVPPQGPGMEEFLAERYRQLFALPGLQFAPATAAPAAGRYPLAAERFGRLLNDIAIDAARRLGAALADDGPDATPITSLRVLHALWIDCGEAAWSAAAHREEFAAALAELLAASLALRRPDTAP